MQWASLTGADAPRVQKTALFGDLHVHSGYSLDAFAFGVIASPDDAYRYGRGEPIRHFNGTLIRLGTPLDFMAVTDHAEYLGVFAAMRDPKHPLAELPLARDLYSDDPVRIEQAVARMKESIFAGIPMTELLEPSIVIDMWRRSIESAEHHYVPGQFTTFIGFEWSSTPDATNLHRNVIFAGGAEQVPQRPFSALDDQRPESLWAYLDRARQRHGDVMAIPHNSNLSDGRMFPAYRAGVRNELLVQRLRNEPVVEIVQIKGASETHPLLSPNDEWADFELLEELMGNRIGTEGQVPGSYLRDAWNRGLTFAAAGGTNPYAFGVAGGSDSHNASSPVEEFNYTGKIGRADATPTTRRDGGSITSSNLVYSAAGLTGVWAESNSRRAIFEALRRRESFATSGTRIRLRVLGAWTQGSLEMATEMGTSSPEHGVVPMGSELTRPSGNTGNNLLPRFFITAISDVASAPVQRIQVIKGWLHHGTLKEKVIDIACTQNREPDPTTGRCPPHEKRLDLVDCKVPQIDAPALQTFWVDESFSPDNHAYYYFRVLEHPTCRWSTFDALREHRAPPDGVAAIIQERAWSSPIWYSPESESTAPGVDRIIH
jgi:hypothetical protein